MFGQLAHSHYRCGVVPAMPSHRSMPSSRRRYVVVVVVADTYTSARFGLLTPHPVVRARQVCGESCCVYIAMSRYISLSPTGPIN